MLNYTHTHTLTLLRRNYQNCLLLLKSGNLLKTALRKNKSNHFKPDLATEIIMDEGLGSLICKLDKLVLIN